MKCRLVCLIHFGLQIASDLSAPEPWCQTLFLVTKGTPLE